MDVRRRVAESLERGAARGALARALAVAWGAASAPRVAREIALPRGSAVVGVGGATLGGSGRTPTAVALVRALAASGERVALVGHGYGARVAEPRVVAPGDDLARAGDEALVAARDLGGVAEVLVGADRAATLAWGARRARVLVVDGLLQARPSALAASLLAVDAERPFGAAACPPVGDLRAPAAALLAACDRVVRVGDGVEPSAQVGALAVTLRGARARGGEVRSLTTLAHARVGLLLGVARPERVARMAERAGLAPACVLAFGDHEVPSAAWLARAARQARDARLDAWLATPKCAVRLPPSVGAAPVLVLVADLALDPATVEFVRTRLAHFARRAW